MYTFVVVVGLKSPECWLTESAPPANTALLSQDNPVCCALGAREITVHKPVWNQWRKEICWIACGCIVDITCGQEGYKIAWPSSTEESNCLCSCTSRKESRCRQGGWCPHSRNYIVHVHCIRGIWSGCIGIGQFTSCKDDFASNSSWSHVPSAEWEDSSGSKSKTKREVYHLPAERVPVVQEKLTLVTKSTWLEVNTLTSLEGLQDYSKQRPTKRPGIWKRKVERSGSTVVCNSNDSSSECNSAYSVHCHRSRIHESSWLIRSFSFRFCPKWESSSTLCSHRESGKLTTDRVTRECVNPWVQVSNAPKHRSRVTLCTFHFISKDPFAFVFLPSKVSKEQPSAGSDTWASRTRICCDGTHSWAMSTSSVKSASSGSVVNWQWNKYSSLSRVPSLIPSDLLVILKQDVDGHLICEGVVDVDVHPTFQISGIGHPVAVHISSLWRWRSSETRSRLYRSNCLLSCSGKVCKGDHLRSGKIRAAAQTVTLQRHEGIVKRFLIWSLKTSLEDSMPKCTDADVNGESGRLSSVQIGAVDLPSSSSSIQEGHISKKGVSCFGNSVLKTSKERPGDTLIGVL